MLAVSPCLSVSISFSRCVPSQLPDTVCGCILCRFHNFQSLILHGRAIANVSITIPKTFYEKYGRKKWIAHMIWKCAHMIWGDGCIGAASSMSLLGGPCTSFLSTTIPYCAGMKLQIGKCASVYVWLSVCAHQWREKLIRSFGNIPEMCVCLWNMCIWSGSEEDRQAH